MGAVSLALLLMLLYPSTGNAGLNTSVLFATDYVYGGYSKSNGKAVAQLNLDYTLASGAYAGLWWSPVDFNDSFPDSASLELSPYLGWGKRFGLDWRLDGVLSLYVYNGNLFGKDSDYYLIDMQLVYRDMVTAQLAWTDNFYNRDRSYYEYNLSFAYPVSDSLDASVGLGFSKTSNVLEYDYVLFNAGVSWYQGPFAVDFRLMNARDVDDHSQPVSWLVHPKQIHSKWVLSVSYAF